MYSKFQTPPHRRSGGWIAIFFGAVSLLPAQSHLWSTLAGDPVPAPVATNNPARLSNPSGLAVDANDNLYVSESRTYVIRRITPDGVIAPFAGSRGNVGAADGPGEEARFNRPESLAVDASGNLFVADSFNHVIRKITADGRVTTFAGRFGEAGLVDGVGEGARFNIPLGLAFDSAGNLFVADSINQRVRRITPGGAVSTLAGGTPLLFTLARTVDGTGINASFGQLVGATVDAAGTVYVADQLYNTIRRITPAGVVTTLAGTNPTFPNSSIVYAQGANDGTGTAARFHAPQGLASDRAGNIYVADRENATIRKITPAGAVTTFAGTAILRGQQDGVGGAARFDSPTGLAFDRAGTLYVIDSAGPSLRKISATGAVTTLTLTSEAAGPPAGAPPTFQYVAGLATDRAGNVYVADSTTKVIYRVAANGVGGALAGSPFLIGGNDGNGSAATFGSPAGLAVDPDGNVYVADLNTIRKITPTGAVSTLAGTFRASGSADGQGAAARFGGASAVAVDRRGTLFVADGENHTIRRISADGTVTTLAGSAPVKDSSGRIVANLPDAIDGTGAAARFNTPSGLTVDETGNVFVADSQNHLIRKITPEGVVTTFAGVAKQAAAGVSAATTQLLNAPSDVAVDRDGTVWVVDSLGLRRITPNGIVASVAGGLNLFGYLNGPSESARFNLLTRVAVDGVGNVFVAEGSAGRVRRGAPIMRADPSVRFANISIRTTAGTGASTLILGVTISGGTAAAKPVLLRAIGPALSAFGVGNVLADPQLTVFQGDVAIAGNDNWGGDPVLAGVFARVGAFALASAPSRDAALYRPDLAAGSYSVQIGGVGGATGVTLAEIYDASPSATFSGETPRLTNLASRTVVGAGDSAVFAGFVIAGNGPKSVLIRVVGPGLATFGVSGALADPRLELFSGTDLIASNDDWGGGPELSAVFAAVGAFPLSAGSKDAALRATLAPGPYSVRASGPSGASGVGLIEIYEAP